MIFVSIYLTCAFGPEDWETAKSQLRVDHRKSPTPVSGSSLNVLFYGPVHFYREHLSKKRTAHCPCYPSCSKFAVDSFKKYGFFFGSLMTVDRMFYRENSSMSRYYLAIKTDSGYRFKDVPEMDYIFTPKKELEKIWLEK